MRDIGFGDYFGRYLYLFMKILSVCGITKSGKTTTIENIIRELKSRGYRVGSVKEIHNEKFAIDPEPTSNTRRHRMAGAELVCARGLYETDFLFPEMLPMKKILSFYENYDWVVLEGVSDIPVPTIVTAHEEKDLIEKFSDMTFCVSGKISANIGEYRGVPAINSLENITGLVDLIENSIFRSKRNTVVLRGGVVEKHLSSVESAEFELAMLEKLYKSGVKVPYPVTKEGSKLKMPYIRSETLPDLFARLESSSDQSEVIKAADELVNWFEDFYKAVEPGEIRGDVNGRNFLWDGEHWRGVDFEERAFGEKEQDIGRVIAFALTYDPPGTPVKILFAERVLRGAVKILNIDPAVVLKYRDREFADMNLRRNNYKDKNK